MRESNVMNYVNLNKLTCIIPSPGLVGVQFSQTRKANTMAIPHKIKAVCHHQNNKLWLTGYWVSISTSSSRSTNATLFSWACACAAPLKRWFVTAIILFWATGKIEISAPALLSLLILTLKFFQSLICERQINRIRFALGDITETAHNIIRKPARLIALAGNERRVVRLLLTESFNSPMCITR